MTNKTYAGSLVDLWKNEVVGHVLVDARGNLYQAAWPGEFRALLQELVDYRGIPVVALRPLGLQADPLWFEFLAQLRTELDPKGDQMKLWEAIESGDKKGEAWDVFAQKRALSAGKRGTEPRQDSWVHGLGSHEELLATMREGHRFGSGPVYRGIELSVPDHISQWRFF